MKRTFAAMGIAAISMLALSGVASAAKDADAGDDSYNGAWVSVHYDAKQRVAIAQSSQDLKPWLEYQYDLPFGLGDNAFNRTASPTESGYGRAEVRGGGASDGPFRACVKKSLDIGGGSAPKVTCTPWVNGR